MRYVLAINNQPVEWPYSERQWRKENPNISMRKWADCSDETLASVDVYRVEDAPRPAIDERTQCADRPAMPSLVDGVWAWGWDVTACPQAQIDAFDDAMRRAIKEECMRRILVLAPEWKQRNITATMVEISEIPPANRTGDMLKAINDARAVWAQIKALRARSDTLEAMTPVPADYADDKWWVID